LFANTLREEFTMKFNGKDASLREHVQRLGDEHEAGILDRIAADADNTAPIAAPDRGVEPCPDIVVMPGVPNYTGQDPGGR